MDRPLDTVTLRLVVAVCEEGSIARAAARESIVPSALSKRIAALERELGVPLFVRQRRGVQPTPAGEALLRQARELFATLDRLRADIGGYGTGVQGSVQVLASPSALAERLPDDIAAFLSRHPRVRVGLDERMSPDIVRAVRDGAADIGVLWDLADLAGLQVLPYRSDRLCVALPPQHALARRPRLRLADTLEHVSIGVVPGGLIDTLLRRQAALAGRLPQHRMQVSSLDAACRMVAAGLGLAILPREAAAPFAGAGRVALVPLDERWAERRFVLCSRSELTLSASTRLLLEHLQQAAGDRN